MNIRCFFLAISIIILYNYCMCFVCNLFNTGYMKPKEVARALVEMGEKDLDHTNEIMDIVYNSNVENAKEFETELMKIALEYEIMDGDKYDA